MRTWSARVLAIVHGAGLGGGLGELLAEEEGRRVAVPEVAHDEGGLVERIRGRRRLDRHVDPEQAAGVVVGHLGGVEAGEHEGRDEERAHDVEDEAPAAVGVLLDLLLVVAVVEGAALRGTVRVRLPHGRTSAFSPLKGRLWFLGCQNYVPLSRDSGQRMRQESKWCSIVDKNLA